MVTSKVFKYSFLIIFVLAISGFFFFKYNSFDGNFVRDTVAKEQQLVEPPELDRVELIEIVNGSTYGELMSGVGISADLANQIYKTATDKYDLVKIKVGHNLEITFDKNTDQFKQLVYKIDSEDELAVYQNSELTAEIRPIPYEVKIVTKGGVVESSMYEAALKNNIDERAIIALADVFQWTIDFALDPRVNDGFKFVYEERYLNGEYQMPGRVLAGEYVNAGQKYQVYYFEEDKDNVGYFDENGNSVQKMFLKAPVSFRYISSGFTTGARYIEAFNISTGHRAVDYAAKSGTPIRSVGDGTVIMASRNGSYGNMVKVRHNGTYQTNYGHMSKFAVKQGNKVKQGDIIGYVGSTGLSTGPHLHYEMEKNGVKINPLLEIQPPGRAIKKENKPRFLTEMQQWQIALGK
ncbi:peptidase M23 [Candidatus Falkowbacteria bacterium CG10_big_fil_rev_8_21_14_0_10_37_14]|uniref:Peptidase M23 n=1 Tax=Candidatus Falkowbacteria bacterium CG10_big_fil_rev_8_21_14_0_10_37_14 TaxID=1974561 RepID=A0A2M6WSD3_9BACT|nr:M23 family metallopeptidase [Candidatus Falkowbacteria bacterium]PIT95718.1 MAG: peptidase M23 [Candidatus Falkowbacteria bacterium CG10_big_fil_rev_8_21_14_0_10_37_14]